MKYRGDIMKTLKALKIISILNGIFCFCCIASTGCMAINRFFDINIFFRIGDFLVITWIVNPIGIISFVICLTTFIVERASPEARQVIGKKWIWIFIWPVVTTVIYILSGVLFVAFTGGV